MTTQIEKYLAENRDRHLEQLKEFLRILSISTLSEHRDDLSRSAEFLADHLQEIGFENVSLLEMQGNSVVYGDWLHAQGALPYVTQIDHQTIQLTARAFKRTYDIPCHFIRAEGSIPFVENFYQLFCVPVVIMGLALPMANAHTPNKRFSLENAK